MDDAKRTPVEIDTELSELTQRAGRLRSRIYQCEQYAEKGEGGDPRYSMWRSQREAAAKYAAELAPIQERVNELGAEFSRRGGWRRYFLVANTGGHVHRGMNCSTCFVTTEYVWLVDLADCDEAAMVEQYGETACTVCFPDAPSHPAWARSVAEREAAEKAKADARCPGSGTYADAKDRNRVSVECKECGKWASVTKTGKLRTHKRD